MKKKLATLLLPVMLVAGCGSSANLEAVIQEPVRLSGEQETVITMKVTENGQPVTGLRIQAVLEMKKMDHGTVEVAFVESGNGIYQGKTELPMSGDWIANVKLTGGKQTVERTIPFRAERADQK